MSHLERKRELTDRGFHRNEVSTVCNCTSLYHGLYCTVLYLGCPRSLDTVIRTSAVEIKFVYAQRNCCSMSSFRDSPYPNPYYMTEIS